MKKIGKNGLIIKKKQSYKRIFNKKSIADIKFDKLLNNKNNCTH